MLQSTKISERNLYRKIVVGYDGSENSERALERAIELASESGAKVRIVTVSDNASFILAQDAEIYSKLLEEANERAKHIQLSALAKLENSGVRVEGEILEGSPVNAILSSASEFKADLIVVGRRGVRGLKRFLIGSVSSAIVSNSKCDVLVVK